MGTKSFVDAYEQMIRRHNDKVMGANENSTIIKQADEDKKKQQDDEDIDLSLDEDQSGDDQVQDQEDDVEDEDDFSFDDEDDGLADQPQSEYNPDVQNIEMNFSIPLAQEFVQTVNQFTKLCAEIVQKRSVPKDSADKLDKYMRKIKNIVQAAEDSV